MILFLDALLVNTALAFTLWGAAWVLVWVAS